MKKLVVLLFVLAVIVFTVGPRYYNHKIEVSNAKSVKAFNKEQQQELQKEKEKLALLEKNKSKSILDWLKYTSTQKNQITISVFGSSVTAGSGSSTLDKHWSGLLENYLSNKEGLESISLTRHGYGGYTTQRLITENKINDVIADKPDLVIIEPTIINNYGSNISLDQTNTDTLYFVNEIKKNLPNTLIIIQSSDPTDPVKFSKGKNKVGFTYSDYVNDLQTFTRDNHLNYVDIYTGMENLLAKNHKQLGDILSDDRHPNDLGYEYWFETLKTSFENVPLVNS